MRYIMLVIMAMAMAMVMVIASIKSIGATTEMGSYSSECYMIATPEASVDATKGIALKIGGRIIVVDNNGNISEP